MGSADPEGVLPAITLLRKLCNHPKLLLKTHPAAAAAGKALAGQPPAQPPAPAQDQQKMAEVAEAMLQQHIASVGMPVDAIELSGNDAHSNAIDDANHGQSIAYFSWQVAPSVLSLLP
jgi:hypothetical protein